jgi:hypothetical protein
MSAPTKGIIFYTDNRLNLKIAHMVQKQLKKIGLPITSASLKPMTHFGENFVVKIKRGKLAYFTQILTALKKCKADIIYFAEHDCLYHKSHFEFTPPEKDKFYFNTNVYKWRYPEKYFLKVNDCKQISGMVCYREHALKFYAEKFMQVSTGKFDNHFEPQRGRVGFESKLPNIDIRHDKNMTKNRWNKEDFRNQKYTDGWLEVKSVEGWEGFG